MRAEAAKMAMMGGSAPPRARKSRRNRHSARSRKEATKLAMMDSKQSSQPDLSSVKDAPAYSPSPVAAPPDLVVDDAAEEDAKLAAVPEPSVTTTPAPKEEEAVVATSTPTIVVDGIPLPFYGSASIKDAIRRDEFMPLCCCACDHEIFCLFHVDYYVCPVCTVIAPLLNSDQGTDGNNKQPQGVGLGFTIDHLQELQWDFIQQDCYGNHQH